MRRSAAVSLIVVALLAGCASPAPDDATPSRTSSASESPSPTPTPTATPAPTPTVSSDDQLVARCIELALPFYAGQGQPTDHITIDEQAARVGPPQRDGYQAVYVPATNPEVAVPEGALACQLHADPSMEPLAYAGVTRYSDDELADFLGGVGMMWEEYPG